MTDGSRKVLIRVVGAPLLLAAVGLVLWVDYPSPGGTALRLLLAGVAALSSLEFYGLCADRGIPTARVAGTAAAAAMILPWPGLARGAGGPGIPAGPAAMDLLVPALLVLYVLGKLVFRHGAFPVEGAAFTLAGFAYVGLLAFLVRPPLAGREAWYYLLFLLAANKGSDMAAYAAGKAFGRHRMAPRLSPNKTWEGAVAGAAAGTAAGGAVLLASPLRAACGGIPAAGLLGMALVVTIASQVGDLAESAFKRWAGVKDSGRLLPEFGGMLDLVDGFLVSVPVAHVLFRVLAS